MLRFNVRIPENSTWPEYKKIFLAKLPGILEKSPSDDYKGIIFLTGEGIEAKGVILPEEEYAELLKTKEDLQTIMDIILKRGKNEKSNQR